MIEIKTPKCYSCKITFDDYKKLKILTNTDYYLCPPCYKRVKGLRVCPSCKEDFFYFNSNKFLCGRYTCFNKDNALKQKAIRDKKETFKP